MDAKVLAEVIAAVTERSVTAEHAHMLKPWEMVLGGLVLPMLAEADESVKADPKYAELSAKYDKGAVEAFFAEKVRVEERVRIQKTVEKIVVGGQGMTRMPTLHQTVKDEQSGKFRRLKDKINKPSNKKNDIPREGRDAINKWWNANQRLTDKGDCQPIADEINSWGICQPLSAAQVSGWLSWLCRLALDPYGYRVISGQLKRGKYTVRPIFTPALANAIANNKLEKAEDRRRAAEAKKVMKAEKAAAQVMQA